MTSAEDYISKMKKIYRSILIYINNDQNASKKLSNLTQLFDKLNILDNLYDIKAVFYTILKIANNHYRGPDFFTKIESILKYFKDEMKDNFTNTEIFSIFQSNKRILLYLVKKKIITFDENLIQRISNRWYSRLGYPEYFAPEIEQSKGKRERFPEEFDTLRKEGENHDDLCEIIRNDSSREFLSYVKKNEIQFDSIIKSSIFETNNFLLKKEKVSLIEYAAFHGSIRIVKRLIAKKVEIKPSLMFFAIHSKNIELVELLKDEINEKEEDDEEEEKKKIPYEKYFYESIKCHHTELADYFLDNFLKKDEEDSDDTFIQSIKSHNYVFMQSDLVRGSMFYDLCKHDYYQLVKYLIGKKGTNINAKKIIFI